MNRKQFGILLVLLIVLGGAGLLLQRSRQRESGSGEQGAGRKLLGDAFDVNAVAHIAIKQGTNELNLVKKDDSWRVRERNDYDASFSQIGDLLLKLKDMKVVQVEEIGPSQLARLQLVPPGPATNTGVLVEFKDKDEKLIKSLTLGKSHNHKPAQASGMGDEGWPDGRYVMVSGDAKEALLVSDPLSSAEAKPASWLKKDFFKIERPKSIEVTFPVSTNSWKLSRDTETGEWKLADAKPGEKTDSTKVSGVTSPFSSPSFNDVAAPSGKLEEYGLDKPTVITVNTFDDFTYTVKVGAKKGDDYPLAMSVTADFSKPRTPEKDEKPADKEKADKAWADRLKQLQDKLKQDQAYEKWIYLVSSWSVDPILKSRKDLLEEKKTETKTEATEDKDKDKPGEKADTDAK